MCDLGVSLVLHRPHSTLLLLGGELPCNGHFLSFSKAKGFRLWLCARGQVLPSMGEEKHVF